LEAGKWQARGKSPASAGTFNNLFFIRSSYGFHFSSRYRRRFVAKAVPNVSQYIGYLLIA
jgi:hypothetical protein